MLVELIHLGCSANETRKLSAAIVPMNCLANTILMPAYGYTVERTQLRSINTESISSLFLVKNASTLFALVSSPTGSEFGRVLHATIGRRDISHNVDSHVMERCTNLLKEISSIEDTEVDECSNLTKCFDSKNDKELERRRKIGLGNKGKVPWNKGRKHSAETRERIKQKTREALSNPKVRKKMSEYPRLLSEQTKAKIGTALKKIWGKRLKWKRTRQKFFQSWAERIATAAKEGGIDEEELEWDSYEKMKSKIALIEQEQAQQMEREKEMARIRAEITGKGRLSQNKKKLVQKTKLEGQTMRRIRKRSKEEKEDLAISEELKLKARLVKIHRRKSVITEVRNRHQRAWEKMELTTQEDILPRQITLADQIRLAKIRRAEAEYSP